MSERAPDPSDEVPDAWQRRMVEMIRGQEALDGSWFTGGPVCDPLEQIDIYRRQYRLRLYGALLTEIPGLHLLLGETEQTEALLWRYLDETPSRSFTLNRVADTLADWLAEQPNTPIEVLEMARLDRAVARGFEAAPGIPIDPALLTTLPPLMLQPHVSLLRLSHNVHEIRSALLTKREAPALVAGDHPLVVFRRGIAMRHWLVPLPLWALLDAIARGSSVAAAIDEIFTRGLVDAATLSTEIGGWFRDLASRQIVQVVQL